MSEPNNSTQMYRWVNGEEAAKIHGKPVCSRTVDSPERYFTTQWDEKNEMYRYNGNFYLANQIEVQEPVFTSSSKKQRSRY